ncbi:hypothetical protein YEEN111655_09160 [Yersinia entomophaga]
MLRNSKFIILPLLCVLSVNTGATMLSNQNILPFQVSSSNGNHPSGCDLEELRKSYEDATTDATHIIKMEKSGCHKLLNKVSRS